MASEPPHGERYRRQRSSRPDRLLPNSRPTPAGSCQTLARLLPDSARLYPTPARLYLTPARLLPDSCPTPAQLLPDLHSPRPTVPSPVSADCPPFQPATEQSTGRQRSSCHPSHDRHRRRHESGGRQPMSCHVLADGGAATPVRQWWGDLPRPGPSVSPAARRATRADWLAGRE